MLGNRVEYFEYELLSLNGGIYRSAGIIDDVVSCNINIDFERDIIGASNLVLKNNTDINYLSDLIRPWYCLVDGDTTTKYPLGTFMLISPDRKTDGKLVIRNITGYDLLYALEQDKLEVSYSAEIGENVIDLVKDLLDSVGDWVTYSIDESDEVLTENMFYEIGRSKLFVINGLLNTMNYYPLWCSGNGTYKAIPWSEVEHISWEFLDDLESLYDKDVTQEIDYSELYNKVILVANQTEEDTEPLVSVLTFEDIDLGEHPFSYTSIGRYVTKKLDSEAVSQDYLDLRAERELRKMLQLEESIIYKHAFITSREDGIPYQGDCYKFRSEILDLENAYKIMSMNWELKTGSLVNSVIRRLTNV